MLQDRKRHIENLKREIGLKFGRTIESAADFDMLSIAIQQATSETISPSTLKRIFGYVKSDAAPSATTLSILSRYVGYTGWSDFCGNYIPSETGCGLIHKSIRTRLLKQKRLILFLTITCIVLTASCILLSVRLDNVMAAYRDAVSDSTVTVIRDTVFEAAPAPAGTQAETDEEKYREIRQDCIMKVRHMTDSVMALRSSLPLYRYVEKCDSAYFHIAFDYMKPYISSQMAAAFPDNDTLRTVHGNALFIECRDQAMILMTHITTEERQRAHEEKFGQVK